VLAVARHLRDGVLACFGIELSLEPTLIGCSL
jgi:UDP-N-acetylenolpyruvoylglucosamine reductase